MNPLDDCIEHEASEHRLLTPVLADEKTRLVKEIGRLRVQLHQVQFLDKSEQRSEFLRNEIAYLTRRIDDLRRKPQLK